MPIYEYACQACDKKFEKLVRSMTSKEKIACPACGSTRTERTMSVFAVASQGAAEAVNHKRKSAGDAGARGRVRWSEG